MANTVNAQSSLLDGETITGADLRRELLGGTFSGAGIVRGLNAQALPTPDMRVRLPAGLCMVTDGTGGFYPLYLPTQTDLDIAASSATLGRYDSVVAEVVDTGSSASLLRRFRVVTGTPQSSPTPPALPASDQPTAKTLRIANVFVQPNAETNGKIRAQDVTVVASTLTPVPRPVQSIQITNLTNPTPAAGVWTDMTSAQWPAITFTVPASGMAYVSVGADCENTTNSTSTARVSFRMSGGFTRAPDFGSDVGGHLAHTASRRVLVTGMPPGATVTVTPSYRLTVAGTAHINSGNMIVEPVA